jgi:hypothetical protein
MAEAWSRDAQWPARASFHPYYHMLNNAATLYKMRGFWGARAVYHCMTYVMVCFQVVSVPESTATGQCQSLIVDGMDENVIEVRMTEVDSGAHWRNWRVMTRLDQLTTLIAGSRAECTEGAETNGR